MGMFDTVYKNKTSDEPEIQIKCLDEPALDTYFEGDAIDLADGCYVGYEGCFVVENRKIMVVTNKMFDKFGGEIDFDQFITGRNPIAKLTDQIEAEAHFGLRKRSRDWC